MKTGPAGAGGQETAEACREINDPGERIWHVSKKRGRASASEEHGWRGWSAPTSAPEVSVTVEPPDGSTCWNPDVFKKKNKIDVHQLRLGHRLQAVYLTTLTSHSQIKPVYNR